MSRAGSGRDAARSGRIQPTGIWHVTCCRYAGRPSMSEWREDRNVRSRARLAKAAASDLSDSPSCCTPWRGPSSRPCRDWPSKATGGRIRCRADQFGARPGAPLRHAPDGWTWRLSAESEDGLRAQSAHAPCPVSRGRLRARPRPVLHLRPAGFPLRVAQGPVERRQAECARDLARLLRRGVEVLAGAERSGPAA